MNETQRKWLLYLQGKGVKFEIFHPDYGWENGSYTLRFCGDPDTYRIHAQPIPDIPDWRELCRGMHSKGVQFECFEKNWRMMEELSFFDCRGKNLYRIPQQPLPEWREKMTEETKPDQKEEIPHREQQIQWHEDVLHHLRTGEPMRQWECRYELGPWIEFGSEEKPTWQKSHKYRRKQRTVTYCHCLVDGKGGGGVMYLVGRPADELREHVRRHGYSVTGQITETTVEIED